MRLSNFAKYAASAKAAFTSRDAATTQQNLDTINAQVFRLKSTVDIYGGGLLGASGISSDQAKLEQDMKNAISDVHASEVVSQEEAQGIIKFLTETLEPTIRACMQSLIAKKTELDKAGLKGTVSADMVDLRKLTKQLGEAMLNKAPGSERASGEQVMNKVDADFAEAIKEFA